METLYWVKPLKERLEAMAEQIRMMNLAEVKPLQVTPEQCGYKGDGKATVYIQKAIDEAASLGGGRVVLANGDYVSGTLVLRSNVSLCVEAGSRILGSTDLSDYEEHVASRRTVMDTNMGMNQSLIFAEGCENISICGEGIIDGQGTMDNFRGEETVHGTPGRPFLMRIIDCKNVFLKGITLKDAACWMQNYLNCENVVLDSIHVENQSNYNNDGIDIDGCKNVWIHDCEVKSGDDALCFKGCAQVPCERVLVENNTFVSSCNSFKIGTDTQGDFRDILVQNCKLLGTSEEMRHIKNLCSDSGISLEMLDGGTVENIYIRDIEMSHCMSPFFMRLEDRGRVKPEDPKPSVGNLKNVVIEHVRGKDCGPRGSYFIGIPEKCIENILLKDVMIEQLATRQPVTRDSDFDEMRGVYPDAHMIDDKGDAPAYGLWLRHVKNVVLDSYSVKPIGDESRPRIVAETDASYLEC